MFKSSQIGMQLGTAGLKLERTKRGESEARVAILGLSFPLTKLLAEELEIDDQCYLRGKPRKELKSIDLTLREKLQFVEVQQAPGSKEPTAELRQAKVVSIRVHKLTKKVGKDTEDSLIATLRVSLDFNDKEIRDFLAANFGRRLHWTFSDEQGALEFEERVAAEKAEAKREIKLTPKAKKPEASAQTH